MYDLATLKRKQSQEIEQGMALFSLLPYSMHDTYTVYIQNAIDIITEKIHLGIKMNGRKIDTYAAVHNITVLGS